jgi:hypothetical protein
MKTTILAVVLATSLMPGAAAHAQESRPSATKAKTAKPNPPPATSTAGMLSPVQQALRRNPDLVDRVAQRLPARIDVMWAASGFRDVAQFVAVVNAADNLQIPFMTLKSRILDDGMNLRQAIRDLRRSSDYRKEARRAEDEAKAMMRKR